MKKKSASRRGGVRPNTGRPFGITPPKKQVTFALAADVREWIAQQPKGKKVAAVEAAIRAARDAESERE